MLKRGRVCWVLVVAVALVVGLLLVGCFSGAYSLGRSNAAILTVGQDPSAIALDPTTRHVFVLNYGDGTISMIDARPTPRVQSLAAGGTTNPVGYDLAVSSDTGRIFIADGGDVVRVLDARSGQLVRAIHLASLVPSFLAVDERTRRVFVSETGAANVATGHTVSVLDAHTGAWLRRVDAGAGAGPLVVDTRTGHIFVQDLGASTVVMLDARSGAPLRTIVLGGPSILAQAHALGGPLPASIGVDAATSRVFVARYGAVAVLNARTGALVHTTQVGRIPPALDVDTRTNRVFVADMLEGTVSMLDARTGILLRTVRVGHRPWALAIATGAGRVCVANVDDNTVSVLDAGSGRVLRTVPTGIGPTAMAVDESRKRVYVVNKLAYRLPPPTTRRGEWARLLQVLPFASHAATAGSGTIPGSVSIISVAR